MAKRRKKTRSIIVFGRRWWRRSIGGGFCTASVYVNGEHVAYLGPQGGSGEFYKQMAADWLRENGYLPTDKPHAPLWCYRDDYEIQLVTESADVPCEKDL